MLKPRVVPPFRLLYDLRWMELGRAGGVEQATYELVAAISHLDRRNTYRILAPRSACWEWDFPPRFAVSRHYSDAAEPLGERFHRFVAECQTAGRTPAAGIDGDPTFDLVHSTCSYIHPELAAFPGVLTIHDLQHLHHPEFFSKEDFELRERLYRESAHRARHIICISEFTRRDVHERYGVPLDRMTTIWNIPSHAVWQTIAESERRSMLARMGVRGPFLLYPAQDWPHKNHLRLLEAWRRAAPALPADVQLVMTGRRLAEDHVAASLLRELSGEGRVVHLGVRSALELRALFQQCLGVAFPSLFEGFGMPVAEAIIACKPVACSNATSLPEVAGDAAVLFDPRDVDDIAGRIVDLVTRADLRASLAAAARRRRVVFSARDSAIRTLGVYARVLEESGGTRA